MKPRIQAVSWIIKYFSAHRYIDIKRISQPKWLTEVALGLGGWQGDLS